MYSTCECLGVTSGDNTTGPLGVPDGLDTCDSCNGSKSRALLAMGLTAYMGEKKTFQKFFSNITANSI